MQDAVKKLLDDVVDLKKARRDRNAIRGMERSSVGSDIGITMSRR